MSDERVLVGTDSGRLLLFESGELKSEINVKQPTTNSDSADKCVMRHFEKVAWCFVHWMQQMDSADVFVIWLSASDQRRRWWRSPC